MRLRVNSLTGEIELGPNVVAVTPSPPAAGYNDAVFSGDTIEHISGTSSGKIYYEIINPMEIKNNHTYQITFTDTILANQQGPAGYDTVTTKSYFLTDVTNPLYPDTLVNNEYHLNKNDGEVIDGFRLAFDNIKELRFNENSSFWSRDSLWTFNFFRYATFNVVGTQLPFDYRIIFTEEPSDSSMDLCMRFLPNSTTCYPGFLYAGKPVNFFVERRISLTGDDEIDWIKIPFAFIDVVPFGEPDGYFNADGTRESDWIVFMDYEDEDGNPWPSWAFYMNLHPDDSSLVYSEPLANDTAFIIVEKPFLPEDIYEFTAIAPFIDSSTAKEDLEKIKVVPNPYYAANAYEGQNTFTSGRGPREIQFRNLPQSCTIRIYTISGELVRVINHRSDMNYGSGSWDLLTEDNLTAAYGIYVYHVEAHGVGERVGKLAIIK